MTEKPSRALVWFRIALAVAGVVVVVVIVERIGWRPIVATLRPAVRWLPLLCIVEAVRIACDTLASRLGFGTLAPRIPLTTLYRAHVIGQSLGALAPAPRVVNESIKVGLLAPYVGAAAATSVGFINQAATLIAGGLFSIPCGLAMFALGGGRWWLWAAAIHGVVLMTAGLVLRAVTRADGPARWIGKRFPKLAARVEAFRQHNSEFGFFAAGPVGALVLGRCCQVLQYAIAARAVGIHVGVRGAFAAEGVSLIANAIGVVVPGGLGTTDGAFTLASGLLSTTVTRAMALTLLMRSLQILWVPIGSIAALMGNSTSRTKP